MGTLQPSCLGSKYNPATYQPANLAELLKSFSASVSSSENWGKELFLTLSMVSVRRKWVNRCKAFRRAPRTRNILSQRWLMFPHASPSWGWDRLTLSSHAWFNAKNNFKCIVLPKTETNTNKKPSLILACPFGSWWILIYPVPAGPPSIVPNCETNRSNIREGLNRNFLFPKKNKAMDSDKKLGSSTSQDKNEWGWT